MKALQTYFQKKGCTAQFAVFPKSIRTNQSDEDILEHPSKIDASIAESKTTGFNSTSSDDQLPPLSEDQLQFLWMI